MDSIHGGDMKILRKATPFPNWISPLIITAILALVFHRFWNNAIVFRDTFVLYGPAKFQIAEAIKAGLFPGWDPSQYLGMPLAADVVRGVFYPLNLIYLLLPFEPAHRLFVLVHYPLAAIFMDLFLRRRGMARAPALLGALAFALSGYMVGQHGNLPFLIGPAWAPLAFYFMDRALGEGVKWSAGVGAVLALQVLGGEPQSAMITAAVIGGWVILWSLSGRGRRGVVAVAAAAAVSALLSAVQLIPAALLISRSERSGGLALDEAQAFSFHPGRLVELVWPNPFGSLWPDLGYYGDFAIDLDYSNLTWSGCAYLGLPVIALAALGLVRGRREMKKWVAIGMAVSLIIAMGGHTPVHGWLHRLVPLFDWFRYPEKYMAWFTGFIAVAAAMGLEALQVRIKERPRTVIRAAVMFGAAAGALIGISIMAWPAALDHVIAPGKFPAWREYAVANLKDGGAHFLALNLAAAAALIICARVKRLADAAAWTLIAILSVAWWSANAERMPVGSPGLYGKGPVPAALGSMRADGGVFRFYREDLPFRDTNPSAGNTSAYQRDRVFSLHSLLPNLHSPWGLESITGYNAAEPVDGRAPLADSLGPETFRLFNVRYVISNYQEGTPPSDFTVIYNDRLLDLRVLKVNNALPRAYLVDDHAITPALIVERRSDQVLIEADAPRPGRLILSDRHYPGWRAWVDDDETRIEKANTLVRSVRIDKGRHRVRFSYQPVSQRIGLWITLTSLLAAALTTVLAMRQAGNVNKQLKEVTTDEHG